jgi:hypothetical protein
VTTPSRDDAADTATQPPTLPPALQAAVERARSGGPATDDLGGRWDGLRERLDRETGLRARLRDRPTAFRHAAVAVAVVVMVLAVWRGTPRPDLHVVPVVRSILVLGLYGAALVGLVWTGLRPIHRPALPRLVPWGAVLFGAVAVAVVASLPAAHTSHPASLGGTGPDFVRSAVACFVFGTVTAIPVLVLARVSMRDDARLWSFGALLGVLAAVVGNATLYLHCPIVAPQHLWAGHVAVLIPFVAVALASRFRN